MSTEVFISYAAKDRERVLGLVKRLRDAGVTVWIDQAGIDVSTMWSQEIVSAIRGCKVMLLSISPHSTESENVVKELALASEREKIILPIYLEQCEIPETMEYQLAGIQNIALYTLDKGKANEFVHQTIRRLGVGQAQEEGQTLGEAEAAHSGGHGTGVGHGHMAPPKAKSGAGKWIGIAAALVVLTVAGFFLNQSGSEAPAPAAPSSSPAAPVPADGTARIALLPIEVNAPREDDKWVGGGMGTQLRAAINKLDGVAIISGVSVNAYRGSNRDINKIRKNLSVNYILDCEMAVAALEAGAHVLCEKPISMRAEEINELINLYNQGNLVAAIKFSKYFELTEDDFVVTILTDSMELYGSRVEELAEERGQYTNIDSHKDFQLLMDTGIDNLLELTHYEKKRIHNLKYFTWIEQQGRELTELNSQWYEHDKYWGDIFSIAPKIDELIVEFNHLIDKS